MTMHMNKKLTKQCFERKLHAHITMHVSVLIFALVTQPQESKAVAFCLEMNVAPNGVCDSTLTGGSSSF